VTQRRILITYPYPLGRATGGARMTREIARHLGRAGARVTILPVSANFLRGIFPRSGPEPEALGFEFDQELARDGVDIVRVAQHPLHWVLDAQNVRDAVGRILGEERVDAVLGYYKEAARLPRLLRRHEVTFGYISTWQSYAKALQARAGGVPRFLTGSVNRRVAIRPHRLADVLFATSRFTRNELVEHFGVERDRIVVCPLGVQPGFFDVAHEPSPGITRLLFFGRVIAAKGVGDAIEALGALARRGAPPFELRLVGQGWHDWARGLARRHGIADRVDLHGPVGDQELREHLSWAYAAVLPSHFEAFGLAFAEAQAAGLPVIAYAAGSVPEVVLDGTTGWLAPVHDVQALAGCLEAALTDEAEIRRRGVAARERVHREFTWQNTAATILAGLDRVRAPDRSALAASSTTGT